MLLARDSPKVLLCRLYYYSYTPALNGKTLLLKGPHALLAEYGGIKLGLSQQLTPHWLIFVVPPDTLLAAGRKLSPTVLLGCALCVDAINTTGTMCLPEE